MYIVILAIIFLASLTFAEEVIELDAIDLDEAIEIVESDEIPDAVNLNSETESVEPEEELEYPELIETAAADCPPAFIGSGIEGVVRMELLVNEEGGVDSVTVIQSLDPDLDDCAAEAARQFLFTPARANGEAVAVLLVYEYHFDFPKIPPEETVAAEAPVNENIVDDTAENAVTEEDIALLNDNFELVVYGREEVKEVARHRITMTEVRRVPGLGGDAARVVQAMPGVARPRFGGTEVIVRGAPAWASRYFIDGMTVPLLYHMGGQNSVYPAEALDGVDFYPGGFGVRYGGAVGGVIEMHTRKSKTDRLQGHIDMNMLNGALFIEGPINERISFMASARRNFTGDLLKLYFEHAAPANLPFSIAPFSWDYLLRTDVKINENHNMYALLMGSRDSIGIFVPDMNRGSGEIDGQDDEMTTMVMFHTLLAGLDSKIGGADKLTNTLRVSGTYAATRMSLFGMASMEETPLIGHLRNQLGYEMNEKLTARVGADIELINENLTFAIITGQNMIIRDTLGNWLLGIIGGYMNFEWRPIDKLLLIPGARYDYYPELKHAGNASFRISGRYELNDAHTLKAAVGTYSQTPQPIGIVIHEQFGEPDLPPTKAAQHVIGHEWRITDLLSLDAQAYYNYMWDVPRSYNSRIDYDPSREIQARYFSDGLGRMYGIELMLRRARTENFFGWISYSLSRSEIWSKTEDKYILSNRDEPHHLQLMGSWKLGRGWDGGVRTRFVSGRPTSPIIGTTENENNKHISPVYGERNSERMDPFFQMDLRFDKKREYNKWTLTYYVDLQNVLWPLYKSPELTYYNYNYTEKQKISMIPMISTGIRAEF